MLARRDAVPRANETGDPASPGSPSEWHRLVSSRLWLQVWAASNSRSLDSRVACRADRSVHALFRKSCAREECGKVFEHCGCEPGRLYCGDDCSEAARTQSAREARDSYRARDTEAGRAMHAAEEAARRERRAREKQGLQSAVGSKGAVGAVEMPSSTASASAASFADAPVVAGVPASAEQEPTGGPPVRVGDQRCAGPLEDRQRASPTASYAVAEVRDAPPVAPLPPVQTLSPAVEWTLVVPRELLGAARRREGTLATCSFCGRRGRIRRVVSTEQWQRWIRRGLDPP